MGKRKKIKQSSLFDSSELGDLKEFDLKDIEFDNKDIMENLNFDLKDRERSLKDLKLGMEKSERKLKKAKREFKKNQKDYYIRFMIEGVNRITKKETRTPKE